MLTTGMVRLLLSAVGTTLVFEEIHMDVRTIGIDLSKTTFHVLALDGLGQVVVRKKFSRKQLLVFTAKLSPVVIGMEACGGAHYLGRALRSQGHDVRLMPAQYVKPYVK